MKRLIQQNINSGTEYDKIYFEREKKLVNWSDLRRWKNLVSKFKKGKILDVGCLDSLVLQMAKTIDPDCTAVGIDIAEEAIKRMNEKNIDTGISFEVQDLYKTTFQDNDFDYIVMGEVLEHLEEPKKAIQESMRLLKSKGILALSVPLNEALEPGAVDGHRHLWSFTIQDAFDLLKPYGNVQTKILKSKYFPTYLYTWPNLIAYCKKK